MIALKVISPSTNPTSPSTELLPLGASVPIGQRGQVIVEGLNKMATTQQMGISWVIKDPDGNIPAVEGEYSAWGLWPHTPPGETHTFSGGYFLLDKAGTWRIGIGLFLNPDSPVEVASYDGDLCMVTTEVPLVYPCPYCEATFATKAELDAHIKSEHPEEVEKKFPWTLVLIGGGAVIAIAGLAAAKRR